MAAWIFVGLIALLQQSQIMAAEVIQKLKCHFFFIQRVASDCTAGRKVIAAFFDDNFWPQHTRGIVKPEIVCKEKALFGFGNTGFVTGFGRFFADHAVNQGGFADVRDTTNQDTQRLLDTLAMRNHGTAGLGNFAMRAGFGRIKRNSTGILTAVVVFEPNFGALRIGKVLFV